MAFCGEFNNSVDEDSNSVKRAGVCDRLSFILIVLRINWKRFQGLEVQRVYQHKQTALSK